MAGTAQVTRIQVTAAGHRWRVHGHMTPTTWHPHLVELVGALACDVPIDKALATRIKAAISQHLEGARVGYLPPELILVQGA